MDLKGKNVVYVGGFGGIGFATCQQLVQKNVANLFILDLVENKSAFTELKASNTAVNIYFKQLDLRQKDSIIEAIKDVICKIEYFDVLVNGSAIFNEADVDGTIAVNLLGLMHTTLTAIPYMDKSKGGRGGLIINIASVAGLQKFPTALAYASSKHGVIGFTKSIADEYHYRKTGIAVMAICPGITETNMIKSPTFEVTRGLALIRMQTPESCAANLIKAMETAENDSIWILDLGRLEKVELRTYWSPSYKKSST